MKTFFSFLFFGILSTCTLPAQDITGAWYGLLKVQGLELNLVFNLTKTDKGYKATMDSPDQNAAGIPVSEASFEDDTLTIKIKQAGIQYKGVWKNDTFAGKFTQAGQSFPLDLSKEKPLKKAKLQEPNKPYPYHTEDVTFQNKADNVTLAGTLSLPQKAGKFPVVILISGSGAQNRDQEILGHKSFLVLADHLTRQGIGVLRYDDRGSFASTGDFATATSEDFARDVAAALAYLKTRPEVNPQKIGLIGHSEGGMIAPMVAIQSKDVAFMVLLAGTGIKGSEILLLQQKLIAQAENLSPEILEKNQTLNKACFEVAEKSKDLPTFEKDLTAYLQKNSEKLYHPAFGSTPEAFIKQQVASLATPWMFFFLKYNPVAALNKVKCPVLALNGTKDLQVPPKENLEAIQKALKKAGNKNVVIKELPNLNHLFQECTTGAPSEYAEIAQTFAPAALTEIASWLLLQVK